MLVLALPGSTPFAAALARSLRCAWSELGLHRFPDGESLVRIDAPVGGRCVVLACSLHHPDEKILPLLFAADAARELGATQVGLAAPYLAYMRQDKRFSAGEAISSRSFARLLSASFDFLATVDPHLHRWTALGEIYPIRTSVVAAAPLIARWVKRHVSNPVIIGPDQESEQWVAQVGRLAEAPRAVLSKTRRGDRDVSVTLPRGRWKGCTPVLLDDIISTGRTMVAAAVALARAGMPAPLCIGVHALFEGDALAELLRAGVSRVLTCDTVAHPSNTISVAPLMARAVRELAGARPSGQQTHTSS